MTGNKQQPRVVVVRTAGTNCDQETKHAFELVGAAVDLVHINEIIASKHCLASYHILALPGGFSYGDDLGAGRIFANELRCALSHELKEFLKKGKLVIGICNGFQILVKSGLLPGFAQFSQEATLTLNDSAKFEDRWVYLKTAESVCVWSAGLPDKIYLPVAHAEGKFLAEGQAVIDKLRQGRQIVFRYCNSCGQPDGYPHNPNGSTDDIAGICDPTGRILGLMPHPERHMSFFQHPHWTRLRKQCEGDGLQIFRNGVLYVQKNFL